MFFKQFYVGCLAHASYMIGDGGEAVVVDPSRDIEMYLEEAKREGLTIKWVLETHLHADFVSGHRDLAQQTGATIAIGELAEAKYEHRALKDGDEITIGSIVIRAMHTPGHTPESMSYLVFENAGDDKPAAVLTGDTLFVGDVGRVDILSSRLSVQGPRRHDVRQRAEADEAAGRRESVSRARRRLAVRAQHPPGDVEHDRAGAVDEPRAADHRP